MVFYFFAAAFPTPHHTFPRVTDILLFAVSLLTAAASTGPLIVRSATSHTGHLKVAYGPLHIFFAIYLITTLSAGIIILARRLCVARGLQRLQLQYVALGITLTALGGVAANLLVPLLLGTSRFSRYGPVFSLILVAFTAHSIIRHRLMNLRLIVRRGTTYFLTTLTLAVAFLILGTLSSRLLYMSGADHLSQPTAFLTVLVLAILYQPTKHHLQRAIDRYFFREPYDYHLTLRQASKAITSTLDPAVLLSRLTTTLMQALRPEFLAFYSYHDTSDQYHCLHIAKHPLADALVVPQIIPSSAPLITSLRPPATYFAADEPQRLPTPRAATLSPALPLLPFSLAVPMTDGSHLNGCLLLGHKLSGDPFFTEDIDLLLTLIPQLAVSLRNATLYSQLHFAHQFIESILSAMDSGVIAVDPAGHITMCNTAASALLEVSAETLRNAHAGVLPRPLRDPLFHTLASRHAHRQMEIEIHTKQQHSLSLLLSSNCLQDSSGVLRGAVVVFNDLSQLKQLEVDKRRIERLAAIGALAAGIAHEIKNPLVAIRTFAELLPERFHDEEFRHTFSNLAISEIDRIDKLVASLRGLSLDAERPPHAVSLPAVVGSTLALLQPRLERQAVKVVEQWQDALPSITGDAARLKQLFLNLLVNSLDAMPDGGVLRVEGRRDCANGQSIVAVTISDSGPGIPADLLNNLFEPFVTSKKHGTGLGLSICRGIAEAHRATLVARNNDSGTGASFQIMFPQTTGAQDNSAASLTQGEQLVLRLQNSMSEAGEAKRT